MIHNRVNPAKIPADTSPNSDWCIITWIERTDHRRRRQRALGKRTPIEVEMLHQPVALAV